MANPAIEDSGPVRKESLRCLQSEEKNLHEFATQVLAAAWRKPNGPLRAQMPDSDFPVLLTLEAWQLRSISPDRLTI
jgi:hypothetical protein